MHDPNIVAFEIGKTVTIWHRDPEINGDDDSCGWSSVTLSEADTKAAEEAAKSEWLFWFDPKCGRINLRHASDLAVMAAAWIWARQRVTGKHRSVPLNGWDMARVFQMASNPADNFGHCVAGCRSDKEKSGVEAMADFLALTLRYCRTCLRRPWQHPRWHFWHWRIQIRPWQKFLRWAFSRCAKCGGRFSWGYSPVTHQWNGPGPSLHGEPGVYHQECCL